ncbi:proton motive ATPase 1 [Trypanosoma grayi]|uniref:proton motive ATPase 1 n=1 Tax=Trypanosoma grayi TaxID=71804 RepID=UPI0004F3F20D|nr:proton motive ATPase 1 [Trypanosoma grayi]KEG14181.1 proton motive ATPase 1 [Trypanosoma grayi]
MVLTDPDLVAVVNAMLVSRQVFQRILSYLTYRVATSLHLVCFFFFACFALTPRDYGSEDPDFQFFHLPVLMFMLITLLNDGCLMTIGYDRVLPVPLPEQWNLRYTFAGAIILAAVACGSSLLLLWIALEAWSDSSYPDSWFHELGVPQLKQGKVVTLLYLKISIFDLLTLFSSRTGGRFFFTMAPGLVLLIGAIISLFVSSMAASFWHESRPDGLLTEGLAWGSASYEKLLPLWVWIYCVVWWIIQEIVKVVLHVIMQAVDLFGCVSEAYGGKVIEQYVEEEEETRQLVRRPYQMTPVDAPIDADDMGPDENGHFSPVDVFTPRLGDGPSSVDVYFTVPRKVK